VSVHVSLNSLVVAAGLLMFWVYSSGGGSGSGGSGPRHEISFQEFRAKLLAKVGSVAGDGCVCQQESRVVSHLIIGHPHPRRMTVM
jgi:hypothetical protein